MAIVRLARVTLYGLLDEKESALDALQQAGCSHLIPLEEGVEAKAPKPEIAVDAHEAIKYLKASSIQRPQASRDTDFQFAQLVRDVLDIQANDRALQDEYDQLRKAIEETRPWGNFQTPEPSAIGGQKFFFYLVPLSQEAALAQSGATYQIVRRTPALHVVVLAEHEPAGFPGKKVDLDERPLAALEKRRDRVENELERLRVHRGGLTRWTGLMERSLAEADDEAQFRHALDQTLDAHQVFAIGAWVPWTDLDKVREVANSYRLAMTVAKPTDEDNPPTLLRNPAFLAGGEGTVTFYVTPGYRWWDPSIVVLFSFAVFFAMIISDAAYSAIIGLILFIFWNRLSSTVDGRSLRNTILILTTFSIVWGVMVNSYFGLSFPKGTLPARLHVIDTTNYNFMMMLSILMGAAHLILANLISAWRFRGRWKAFSPLGWVLGIIGGMTLGLSSYDVIAPAFASVGGWMLGIGIFSALSFASASFPPTSIRQVFGWLVDAATGLMGISGAFGDTLSYLRLFALGLSSAQLAATFNQLASDSVQAFGAFGLILAIIIILIGHSLNFVLAIMGGVVHGLRLNCIEFFNWCHTEEGYPFRSFSKKAGTS